MAFVKVENGVVIQKQPRKAEGFIEAPDSVVCGMLYDGKKFTNPQPTAEQLKQQDLVPRYPPIEEQLDAIWKQINYMRLQGDTVVQDANNMLGKILAEKQRLKEVRGRD